MGIPQEQAHSQITSQLITEFLMTSGFSPHFLGFKYIRDAILALQDEPSLLHKKVYKELYGAVAVKNNVTRTQVERNIRHAIQDACAYDAFKKAFGRYLRCVTPTNSEFLAVLYEILLFCEVNDNANSQ